MLKFILIAILLVNLINGDCYLQNPKGSNNRLNGNGRNRANNNRLFDSQNNAAGGYCWGPTMSFYEGSELSVEWTNQHSCGQDKTKCQVILQYMCGDDQDEDTSTRVRDGTTTQTPPDDLNTYNTIENGEYTFGMHETFYYYQDCKTRQRNTGLFIADRTLNGNSARFTRQNNNGARSGFECPEERDYYPYWHPTPWKDIAVLVDDTDRCDFYEENSQNVINKGHCINADGTPHSSNNEDACQAADGASWEMDGKWNLDEPFCDEAPWSRDNHLGNGFDGFTNRYNWTIPNNEDCIDSDSCSCVLRIRYNISTNDYDDWGHGGDESDDFDFDTPNSFIDSAMNGAESPVIQDHIVEVAGKQLELALNTNQYGRVFEDRSHVFRIKPRPSGVNGKIYNLNVRGKRGNIVQTYPATEYDYVPQNLEVRWGEHVHFQWNGCDNNPNGNAGEGTEQTDRSNLVQIKTAGHNYPVTEEEFEKGTVDPFLESYELRQYFAYLGQTECLDKIQLLAQNNNNEDEAEEDVQNCYKLNSASRYFNGGLLRMNSTGLTHYMSTRNNNFTNRSQKGSLRVKALVPVGWAIVITAGVLLVAGLAGFGGAFAFAKSHPHSTLGHFFKV